MLDIAVKHTNEIKKKMLDIWFSEKYKYYNFACYYSAEYEPSKTTWDRHEFVSLNSWGEIIGFISYEINREANYAYSLGIVNFSEDQITFGVDLGKAMRDIFEKFAFNKLKFSVVVGNPIEGSYDKAMKRYGGRIVGVDKMETRLADGKLYDVKRYEITRREYEKAIKRKEREERERTADMAV